MTKAADPSLIDNLWYFDSVVSTKPPIKGAKTKATPPAPDAEAAASHGDSCASESHLPLSTGGESSTGVAVYSPSYCEEEAAGGGRERCVGGSSPSMCELVEKMEEGSSELSAKELDLWMQKLGLEYTDDGRMVRRVPNAEFGSQQKLDFSEFVCLNRFIEDGGRGPSHDAQEHERSSSSFDGDDEHMASLYEVFRLFDRDDNGLISPSELRAALAKLGLTCSVSGLN